MSSHPDLESLLSRARLAEPAPGLRGRILDRRRSPRPTWRRWVPELALAALIVLSLTQLAWPGRGFHQSVSGPAGERLAGERQAMLETWRVAFRSNPEIAGLLEIHLDFLERASEKEASPNPVTPFSTQPRRIVP